MVILIIIGVLFIVSIVIIFIAEDKEKYPSSIATAFASSILLILLLASLSTCMNSPINQTCNKTVFKIKSLNRVNEIVGEYGTAFTIGSGYIGKRVYYYFYVEVEKGIYQLQKERREYVYIKESDLEIPNVEVEECKYIPNKSLWLLNIVTPSYRNEYKYILTIPKNSIIKEFKP